MNNRTIIEVFFLAVWLTFKISLGITLTMMGLAIYFL